MIINGKTYKDADLTFNAVCQMEAMGAPITNITDNVMSAVRAYAAISMKTSVDKAGAELEAHVINGGDLQGVIEAMNAKIEESGFFQALRKKSEVAEETAETSKPKKVK